MKLLGKSSNLEKVVNLKNLAFELETFGIPNSFPYAAGFYPTFSLTFQWDRGLINGI